MLTKRIIACLDVDAGRVVKGVHFSDLRDAGDPTELAPAYSRSGADEIILLDISATDQKRSTLLQIVRSRRSGSDYSYSREVWISSSRRGSRRKVIERFAPKLRSMGLWRQATYRERSSRLGSRSRRSRRRGDPADFHRSRRHRRWI